MPPADCAAHSNSANLRDAAVGCRSVHDCLVASTVEYLPVSARAMCRSGWVDGPDDVADGDAVPLVSQARFVD